jgi:predicted deacetylase
MSAGSLAVVLHDVAAGTQAACERLIAAVHEVADVPLTLLAVPRYHCAPSTRDFIDWLDDRYVRGDEVALHGYTHQDDGVPAGFVDHLRRRHYTRGEGEFADLPPTEAARRITAGVRWFSRQGLVLRGFVAPAWLMSPGTWEALRCADLAYTCTLRRFVLLPERHAFASRGIVYSTSTAWRRNVSLAWNAAVAATLRHNPLLRLELHPHDADHPAIRRSW